MTALPMMPAPELQLPWESSQAEDARYRRILLLLLALTVIIGVVMPLLSVPELSRESQEALPPQLARIVLEKQSLPEPAAVQPTLPEPVPEVAVEPPSPEPEPRAEIEVAPSPPAPTVEQARDVAAAAGVLAFKDTLSDMRDSVDVNQLSSSGLRRGAATATRVDRAVVAVAAAGKSGGIQTSELSRDTGGAALSGREATRVDSQLLAGTRSGNAANAGTSTRPGGRSDASIRRTMDRNKGAIFSIYNRALRKDPTLVGKLVFVMEIAPSGSIAVLELVSSDLVDEALTRKLLNRIRMIDFGAEPVATTRVNYAFDFLPY